MANAVTAFLDDHLAAGRGDRPAIVTPERTWSYGEVLGSVNRVGHALRALGVEPEQRVALLMADGPAWVAVFFGALRIGAIAVPLSTRLSADEYVGLLRDSRAKVLVADAALVEPLSERRAQLPHLRSVVSAAPAPGLTSLGDLCARVESELPPEPVSPDDTAYWLYTSGTTGDPKAAVHLHRGLLACPHYAVGVLGITAEDRILATSRLYFAYALSSALLNPFFTGAQTYLEPRWPDPALVAEALTRFRPTLFFSVPTFYARMLRADLPRDTFASLRSAVSAGERLPAEIYLAYRERYGVEILDGMGATETVFMVLSNRPGQSRPGSSGTPVLGTEARLLRADGREVAPGEGGVLHVKTPSASPRYWNRVDHSRCTFVGEWFRTGDVYTQDTDGFFYHHGREDDFFKVAGQWVAPADVESVLLSHPAVIDAGVVGAEEAGGLVKPFAFVVPRDQGMPSEALIADLVGLAETKLVPHQRPRRVFVVTELPRTSTGKLQRFRLRSLVVGRVVEDR